METLSFSEIVEAIAKELANKDGEELAQIAESVLDVKVEYKGDSVFIMK